MKPKQYGHKVLTARVPNRDKFYEEVQKRGDNVSELVRTWINEYMANAEKQQN
ncbi:TPA: hypothetical protein RUZ13_003393 [Vibrio cholerae]|nr:hypothetical protein [Vibrio cholerae]HDZ9248878.1 hypothetical protein [Vibrio cholerae]